MEFVKVVVVARVLLPSEIDTRMNRNSMAAKWFYFESSWIMLGSHSLLFRSILSLCGRVRTRWNVSFAWMYANHLYSFTPRTFNDSVWLRCLTLQSALVLVTEMREKLKLPHQRHVFLVLWSWPQFTEL